MAIRQKTRVEPTARRVRTMFGGEVIADTTDAKLVWEGPVPWYWIPTSDVTPGHLVATGATDPRPGLGTAVIHTVKTGAAEATDAAWTLAEPEQATLQDHVRFDWDAMDAWFEEDEQIHVHPRDPYHRVDVLPSSRRIEVRVDGETIADTTRAMLLFETGLPTRYYLPILDVKSHRLIRSKTRTACPYKGSASYWNVTGAAGDADDLVWGYEAPIPESGRITGLVCFFNESERIEIIVDGKTQERPRTYWSSHTPDEAVGSQTDE